MLWQGKQAGIPTHPLLSHVLPSQVVCADYRGGRFVNATDAAPAWGEAACLRWWKCAPAGGHGHACRVCKRHQPLPRVFPTFLQWPPGRTRPERKS